jgi:hypothetical protein
MEDQIMRLRSAQDMVRILLGNADAEEADAVLREYVLTKLS